MVGSTWTWKCEQGRRRLLWWRVTALGLRSQEECGRGGARGGGKGGVPSELEAARAERRSCGTSGAVAHCNLCGRWGGGAPEVAVGAAVAWSVGR